MCFFVCFVCVLYFGRSTPSPASRPSHQTLCSWPFFLGPSLTNNFFLISIICLALLVFVTACKLLVVAWGSSSLTMYQTQAIYLHWDWGVLGLEKEMATHSSVLAWRIPGTGEPGGLLSMGSRTWLKRLSSSSSSSHWITSEVPRYMYSPFCSFLSLCEWKSVIPLKVRVSRMDYPIFQATGSILLVTNL